MAASEMFAGTFDRLRRLLKQHAKGLIVQADGPGRYALASRTRIDRAGRPMPVASVELKKNYVSYHLLPVYAAPHLLEDVSPELRKRMQGKSCFNFKTIDAGQATELSALTKQAISEFDRIDLPWAKSRVNR